jgi:ATP-dependent protease ClpP protease subunit
MNVKRKYTKNNPNTRKKMKRYHNMDDICDDSDKSFNPPMILPPELLHRLEDEFAGNKTNVKKVFRDCNHVYFRDIVSMRSIGQLCALIDDMNNDYRSCCDHEYGYIIPKPIYLHICTTGGDLIAGFMAYDYIKSSNIPIYTVSEGHTVSAGTLMFMAGQKRFMTPTSFMLIHQLRLDGAGGTHTELEEEYENCVNMMKKMKYIYMSNLNTNVPHKKDLLSEKDLTEQLKKDHYWDYDMCFKKGLIHGPYTNTQSREIEDKNDVLKNPKKYVKYLQ